MNSVDFCKFCGQPVSYVMIGNYCDLCHDQLDNDEASNTEENDDE